MNNFWLLCKVNLASLLTFNGKKKKNVKAQATKLSAIVLICVLVVGGLGALYAWTFAEIIKLTGGSFNELVPTMISMSAILTFVFSFYAVSSMLYGFKDYDFLASLPVKKSAIILSKLSAMILLDVSIAALISIPALVIYGMNVTLTFDYAVKSLIYAVLSPLLPMTISIVLGGIVTYISSRLKFKNLITTILYFSVFALAFIFGFTSGEDGGMGILKKIYFVMPILLKGYGDIWSFLLYIGLSLVPFAVIILIVSITFEKMNALTKAQRKNKNFRLKASQSKGEFRTLLARDFRRLGTCPVYIMNGVMGAIMPIFIGVALMVLFNGLPDEVSADLTSLLAPIILPFIPAVFAFSYGIAPTTNCAISIEGKAFWLTRTLPIKASKLLNAKLSVNSIIYLTSALISSIILGIGLKLKFWLFLLLIAFTVALVMFFGILALLINIKKPNLDWDNLQKAVKQGASILICMLIGFALAIVLGVIGYFYVDGYGTVLEFLTKISPELYFGILTAIFGVISIYMYIYLMKNAEKLLYKIQN